MDDPPPGSVTLARVLASAARLQELVPDATLVGGSAAAYHARHRLSLDHGHVVSDLADRFDTILDNLEALGEWSTARAQPGKIILGSLGGIESGVRQLRRSAPLEVEVVRLVDAVLTVPTPQEALRVKAWLALSRNQTRDYLDIAALGDMLGVSEAARVLIGMDAFYSDIYEGEDRVATQVARQLAAPRPRDRRVTDELDSYKQLAAKWHEWSAVVDVTSAIAAAMLEVDP